MIGRAMRVRRRDPVARLDEGRAATLHIIVGAFVLLWAPVMPGLVVSAWLGERAMERDLRAGPVATGTATRYIREYSWPSRGNSVVVSVRFTDRSGATRYGEVHEPVCARTVDGREPRDGSRVRVRYDPTGERKTVLAADVRSPCSMDTFNIVLAAVCWLFGLAFAVFGFRWLRGGLRTRARLRAEPSAA